MPEVGVLIVDDDIASQRALKLILDSEGWRVRIVPLAAHALAELATGNWNLAIVNVALLDFQGPLFTVLKELAQAEPPPSQPASGTAGPPAKQFRVLFLVPLMESKNVRLQLEREGLPYALTPYHLHDFLQRVSELLVESGAIPEAIRTVGDLSEKRKRRRDHRSVRTARTGAMFASREDYQMTEEEMAEWERQEREEEERKKREKQLKGLL
jgi:PleD family two-component response regulator